MKVAYFTAGTVGAGHLVRGLALGRALERRGLRGEYRRFGPALPFGVAVQPDYEVVAIDRAELSDPSHAETSALAAAGARFRPDVVIVDLFWAPLYYILPRWQCEAWLLVRHCPPQWFAGPVGMPFTPAQFRRVIAIEPLEHPAITDRLAPLVLCNPEECQPPQALRERLGVPDGRRVIVVAHAGERGECATLSAQAGGEEGTVFTCDLFAPEALFPVAEWLGGADRIFSGAGYNTFWEAQWLGYATRTRFTPFPRKIDDQAWRVRACAEYRMRENGADRLAHWIVG